MVVSCNHWTHRLLSLKICTVVGRKYLCYCRSWMIWCRNWRCLVHSFVAYISASADERAVIFWYSKLQWIEPPSQLKWPDMERILNSDICGYFVCLFFWDGLILRTPIVISFFGNRAVVGGRKFEVYVKTIGFYSTKNDSKILCSLEVSESIFGCFSVSWRWV